MIHLPLSIVLHSETVGIQITDYSSIEGSKKVFSSNGWPFITPFKLVCNSYHHSNYKSLNGVFKWWSEWWTTGLFACYYLVHNSDDFEIWVSGRVGIWNPDQSRFWMVEKRFGCKWYKFQMGSEIQKPDLLKSSKLAAILSKTIWIPGKNIRFLNGWDQSHS